MNWKTVLYRLTFPNGMVYVGVTDDTKRRWATRYKGSVCGDAIEKFGWENIKKDVIVELPPTVQNDQIIRKLEREFIRAYGENSYNRTVWPGHYPKDRYHGKTVTYNGIEKTYRQWQDEPGVTVNAATIRDRIERRGWCVEAALFTPSLQDYKGTPKERRKLYETYGKAETSCRA